MLRNHVMMLAGCVIVDLEVIRRQRADESRNKGGAGFGKRALRNACLLWQMVVAGSPNLD